MRIALLAAGSRGDYQPVLAVGEALRARGHQVGVTATSDYADRVRQAGFAVEELHVDVTELYRQDAMSGRMPATMAGQIDLLRTGTEVLGAEMARVMTDLWPRYDGVVATALTMGWAAHLAARDPRPMALLLFVPALPSVWGDASMFSVRPGVSPVNLLAGLRALLPAARLARPTGAGHRPARRGGLADRARSAARMAGTPALVAHSPQLITGRRVSGRRVRPTGYPFRQPPGSGTLPAPVRDFLAAGPAPVYAGFGSQSVGATREALRHSVVAALQGGHRVIAMRGTGLPEDGYDERVLFVDDAPHPALFPRVAAVVHHGGAGTTAEALRAGVPQVVAPFMIDQPFFARRCHEIGVAAAPVPVRSATTPALAAALRQVADPVLRARAAQVGALVRAERGVELAVTGIETALGVGR